LERPSDLPQTSTGAQSSPDLLIPIHREPPPRHEPLPHRVCHDRTGAEPPSKRPRRWSQSRKSVVPIREIGWVLSKEIRWSQSRKSAGPNQRKSRINGSRALLLQSTQVRRVADCFATRATDWDGWSGLRSTQIHESPRRGSSMSADSLATWISCGSVLQTSAAA
jgi:hypothetical protein